MTRAWPVEPGYVGTVISGIEMKLGENEEDHRQRASHFRGYWNRPEEETARALQDGWFHTGDQGEVERPRELGASAAASRT